MHRTVTNLLPSINHPLYYAGGNVLYKNRGSYTAEPAYECGMRK